VRPGQGRQLPGDRPVGAARHKVVQSPLRDTQGPGGLGLGLALLQHPPRGDHEFRGEFLHHVAPFPFRLAASLQTSESSDVSQTDNGLTASPSARCTPRCTGDAESANEPTADPLADFVASLTAEQRQRLAALLTGQREGDAS
jgi:hypothetical protein